MNLLENEDSLSSSKSFLETDLSTMDDRDIVPIDHEDEHQCSNNDASIWQLHILNLKNNFEWFFKITMMYLPIYIVNKALEGSSFGGKEHIDNVDGIRENCKLVKIKIIISTLMFISESYRHK